MSKDAMTRREAIKLGAAAIAGAVCENPRNVSRGLDSQNGSGGQSGASADTLGIHWLRGSVHDSHRLWLENKLAVLWGEDRQMQEFGFWSYDRHILWPSGVKLLFHSTEEGSDLTLGRIAVEIPGGALDGVDLWQVLMFMQALREHDFQCSRLDIYFDDGQRVVTPMSLYDLTFEECLFTGEPIRHDVVGFRMVRKVTISNRKGRTQDEVSFGKRGKLGCGKYLRVYDKKLESGGANNAVRWELELSDYRAQRAFNAILDSLGSEVSIADWKPAWTVHVLGGLIAWAVDFKIRVKGKKNLERLERYPFWQAILNRLGSAHLAAKQIIRSVEKGVEWVKRGVTGTLQMIRLALGDEVALPLVVDLMCGEDRLRPVHRRAVSEYFRQTRGSPGVSPG